MILCTQVRTLLPASDEAFQLGVEEPSLTLHQALGNPSAQLSPFACRALAAYIFYACLEHSFTKYTDDDTNNPQESEFWKRQHNLDSRLAVLFMALPDAVRCPENLARHDAVTINLTLHTASICIHRVGVVRAKRSPQHAAQSQGAAARLLTAAQAIFAIVNGLRDPQLLFSNPFVAFAAYVAALVFMDDFATAHTRQSEECLNRLMDLMVAIANENLVTASLALQLAGHLKKSGIDPSALDKVRSWNRYGVFASLVCLMILGSGISPRCQGRSGHHDRRIAQRPDWHNALLPVSAEGTGAAR